MDKKEILSKLEIENNLEEIPIWNIEGNTIVREIVAANFVAIIGIVNSIAILAEKTDHHPDILIYGWNKLRITLSTHDRGGLT